VEFPGAIYHVMCRGDRQEAIFKDTTDQETFLKTLGETCTRCGWRVHAYVLMGNHYHLLLETPEANLVEGMRWFQGVYTQRFNARHTMWGHLFQGRYKALLVDGGGDYFATVARYIHLNPARARCFDLEDGQLSDYKPSSYIAYLHPAVRPEWLVVDRGLRSCGYDDTETGRTGYRDYMQKRVTEILHSDNPSMADAAWQSIRRGWIFGSEEFCSQMRDEIDRAAKGCRRDSHSGGAVLLHDEQAAEELLNIGLRAVGLKPDDLEHLKKNDDRKKVVAWLIRKNTSVKNEWVSNALKMGNTAAVSRSIRAVDEAVDGILFELKAKISKFKD
jgi:REP element-mobilizing transposase RayT